TKKTLSLCEPKLDRLLRLVRMLLARVNFQFPVHLFPELRLGEHPRDGVFNHSGRARRAHFLCTGLYQAAGITRVAPVDLLFIFPASQPDLCRVDDDHMIACVDKGGVNWLLLAHQQHRRFAGQPPENLVLGVYHVPFTSDPRFRREFGFHTDRRSPLKYLQTLQSTEARRGMSNFGLPDRAVVVPQNTLVAGNQSRAIRFCLRDDDAVERIAGPALLAGRADHLREGKTADLQTEILFENLNHRLRRRPDSADFMQKA